jgi:hypothetical protein
MLNFLTFTVYTRCKGETYLKWLDSKLQWIGTPPHGYNNHFRIFFNMGTQCERIDYYVQFTILFTFFGCLPFFRPIYLWWHYKQMVQRLVIGGSKATLDDGYSLCSFFGTYLGSYCGCCGHKILVFVDNHLHLRAAGIVAEEGEREMGALFGLQTKDIQIQRAMQPGPDGMADIGMRFVCVAGSLEPLMVTELTPGQPAALSGQIYRNQQIVKINGQDVRGLEMNQVLGLIKGAPGTMVTLTVMQPSTQQSVPVEWYPVSITSQPSLKSHVCGNELYFPSPSVIARMDIGRSSMGGAVLALCTINRDAVNNIGVSFERDSNGVHVASSLFPGLRCTSGKILPGDRLLLINGAAVTGLETEDVARMFLALKTPTVALTVVPKACQGPGCDVFHAEEWQIQHLSVVSEVTFRGLEIRDLEILGMGSWT